MSFLLDADTCSAYLRGVRIVQNRFLQYTGQLYLSTINLGELLAWARRAKAPPQRLPTLLSFLQDVHVVDVDSCVAEKFGELRAMLLDQGLPNPVLDLYVAATALVGGHTLVTHNTQDFVNVPGLSIVDWLVP